MQPDTYTIGRNKGSSSSKDGVGNSNHNNNNNTMQSLLEDDYEGCDDDMSTIASPVQRALQRQLSQKSSSQLQHPSTMKLQHMSSKRSINSANGSGAANSNNTSRRKLLGSFSINSSTNSVPNSCRNSCRDMNISKPASRANSPRSTSPTRQQQQQQQLPAPFLRGKNRSKSGNLRHSDTGSVGGASTRSLLTLTSIERRMQQSVDRFFPRHKPRKVKGAQYRIRIVFEKETTYLALPYTNFKRIIDDGKLIIPKIARGEL